MITWERMVYKERTSIAFIPFDILDDVSEFWSPGTSVDGKKEEIATTTNHEIIVVNQIYENDVPIISLSSSVKVALAVICTLSLLVSNC